MWVSFLLMTTTRLLTPSTQLKAGHYLETQTPAQAHTPQLARIGHVGTNASQRAATEIRGLMGARKLNTVDLAQLLHVSRDTAARRINGEQDLGLNELEAIAGWLDVPVTRIIAPAESAAYSE